MLQSSPSTAVLRFAVIHTAIEYNEDRIDTKFLKLISGLAIKITAIAIAVLEILIRSAILFPTLLFCFFAKKTISDMSTMLKCTIHTLIDAIAALPKICAPEKTIAAPATVPVQAPAQPSIAVPTTSEFIQTSKKETGPDYVAIAAVVISVIVIAGIFYYNYPPTLPTLQDTTEIAVKTVSQTIRRPFTQGIFELLPATGSKAAWTTQIPSFFTPVKHAISSSSFAVNQIATGQVNAFNSSLLKVCPNPFAKNVPALPLFPTTALIPPRSLYQDGWWLIGKAQSLGKSSLNLIWNETLSGRLPLYILVGGALKMSTCAKRILSCGDPKKSHTHLRKLNDNTATLQNSMNRREEILNDPNSQNEYADESSDENTNIEIQIKEQKFDTAGPFMQKKLDLQRERLDLENKRAVLEVEIDSLVQDMKIITDEEEQIDPFFQEALLATLNEVKDVQEELGTIRQAALQELHDTAERQIAQTQQDRDFFRLQLTDEKPTSSVSSGD